MFGARSSNSDKNIKKCKHSSGSIWLSNYAHGFRKLNVYYYINYIIYFIMLYIILHICTYIHLYPLYYNKR